MIRKSLSGGCPIIKLSWSRSPCAFHWLIDVYSSCYFNLTWIPPPTHTPRRTSPLTLSMTQAHWGRVFSKYFSGWVDSEEAPFLSGFLSLMDESSDHPAAVGEYEVCSKSRDQSKSGEKERQRKRTPWFQCPLWLALLLPFPQFSYVSP